MPLIPRDGLADQVGGETADGLGVAVPRARSSRAGRRCGTRSAARPRRSGDGGDTRPTGRRSVPSGISLPTERGCATRRRSGRRSWPGHWATGLFSGSPLRTQPRVVQLAGRGRPIMEDLVGIGQSRSPALDARRMASRAAWLAAGRSSGWRRGRTPLRRAAPRRVRGWPQAHLGPVGHLVADVVELASRQFDASTYGVGRSASVAVPTTECRSRRSARGRTTARFRCCRGSRSSARCGCPGRPGSESDQDPQRTPCESRPTAAGSLEGSRNFKTPMPSVHPRPSSPRS